MSRNVVLNVGFKYVEPLSFRALGDPHPVTVGPASHSTSNPYPLPTTLLGAFLTCSGWYRNLENRYLDETSFREWFRNIYGDIFQGVGPIYLSKPNSNGGEEECLIVEGGLLCLDDKGNVVMKRALYHSVTRVSLEDRFRVAKEGYLFNVRMVGYERGARLSVDVMIDSSIVETVVSSTSCPLGGYSRVAIMEVKGGSEPLLLERLRRAVVENSKRDLRKMALVVVTPILFETDGIDYARAEKPYTGSISPREYLEKLGVRGGRLMPYLERLKISFSENWKVRIAPLNAGWDYRLGRRRPYYAAILPGSYMVIDRPCRALSLCVRELYWRGVGLAEEIGYGRLALIPLWERNA